MLRTLFKISLITLLLGVSVSSCGSYPCISNDRAIAEGVITSASDSVPYSLLFKDSVANCLACPKNVICKLGSRNPADTVRTDSITPLPKNLFSVLRFLFFNPSNFESNDFVYGNFSPSVSYEYFWRGGKQVSLQFDFGLRKWHVTDSTGHVIYGGDIRGNNLELLRFTRMLFPNDSTLQIMNDNLKALQK